MEHFVPQSTRDGSTVCLPLTDEVNLASHGYAGTDKVILICHATRHVGRALYHEDRNRRFNWLKKLLYNFRNGCD